MRRPTLKIVLIAAVPLAGGIALLLTLVMRGDGALDILRRRENAELQFLRSGERAPEEGDPSATLSQLRLAQRKASAGNPSAMRTARDQMLAHGESAVPVLKAVVYRSEEEPFFRMECMGLLADLKEPAASAALLEALGDRTLEERYRSVALARLAAHPRAEAFPMLRRVYSDEPAYANRPLLVKAIGGCPQPECTALLTQAAREDQGTSVRIQALECLSPRAGETGVLDTLQEALFKSPEENIRMAALASLGRSNSSRVDEILKKILENTSISGPLRREAESWTERRKSR